MTAVAEQVKYFGGTMPAEPLFAELGGDPPFYYDLAAVAREAGYAEGFEVPGVDDLGQCDPFHLTITAEDIVLGMFAAAPNLLNAAYVAAGSPQVEEIYRDTWLGRPLLSERTADGLVLPVVERFMQLYQLYGIANPTTLDRLTRQQGEQS